MTKHIWILGVLAVGLLGPAVTNAGAEAHVVPSLEASQTIVIDNLRVDDTSVAGTVVNKSAATVRGVELQLRQTWHWNDELHPGADSPGRTLPFKLGGDVAPKSSAPFTFQIPPLEPRSDGRFVTTMDVTGFTEVGP